MAYKTALIVDDSKLARVTLRKKLQAYGIDVELVESASEALNLLQQKLPDIIFMDHLMPEMDGFEATQAIRQNPAWQQLPIVMCTGKEHEGYLQEAQAIGANQILSKPPVDEALEAILATDFAPAIEPAAPIVEPVETPAFALDDLPELAEVEDALAAVEALAEPELESEPDYANEFEFAESEFQPSSADEFIVTEPEAETAYADEPVFAEPEMPAASALDPIAHALDEERIRSLCEEALAAERPAWIAQVLARVPVPEVPTAPELDTAGLYADLERMIEETVVEQLPVITANIQQQLGAEIEATVADRFMSMPRIVPDAEIQGMISQQLSDVGSSIDDKLKNLEVNMMHHLQATQASAEGLVAEALQSLEQKGSANDLELQLDRLYRQQALLSRSLKGAKVISVLSILLAITAAGALAYLQFLQ